MSEKFPNAKFEPLTREEVKSLIEGKGVRRPAIAMGHWVHIDEMNPEDQPVIEQLFEEYPEDVVVFYVKKPKLFDDTGNKYTWCDVPNADPSIGRTGPVGIDEISAIEWDVYDQISEECPDVNDPSMYSLAPEDDGRYRVAWLSNGPWQKTNDYRGMANSLMDLYLEPEKMHHVAQRVTRFFKAAIVRGVKEAHIDGIAFGDDLGMQKGLFMSPEMFEEFYFPYYKEICDCAHEQGIHVWFHSCGDVKDLIPYLIKAGVDVLHPIQKYALNEVEIANTFKDDLSFWAGMDLQRVLPFGTKEEVIEEVHHFIDTFYQEGKGKLILTLNNRIQNNVPIENYTTFIKEAYHYADEVGRKDKVNLERGIVK